MEGVEENNNNNAAEDLIAQGFEEVWIPKDSPAFEAALKQLHAQGEVRFIDFEGAEVNGAVRRVFSRKK